MNNFISSRCVACGHEFVMSARALIDVEPHQPIGDVFWCGVCDSHDYMCSWGVLPAGASSDSVSDVLSIWKDWTRQQRPHARD